ncbi:MAG: 50S ribosomal protein L21 [Clostridiales bacterium]|jgi:large subunit ribosomal protein L21|nr:50S ribosomal protein L21 [Clostridiales bacterium]HOC09470.1 50S ribosomal protein L21 [Bacillota bacterium]HQA47260.1 50S ribosomal protein L21 [Bacillota bacterium]HQD42199.1 50S ribosomal protein L21 [Bacillota bacterium]
MYAVIETGGKQYKIQEGDILSVERLGAGEGEKVSFDKVLLVSGEDGIKVGKPYVEGAAVEGEVLFHGKGRKIIVFKYKAKKNYRKKQGHRQPFTRVKITKING